MDKGQNTLEALLNFYLFSDIQDEEQMDIYLEQHDLDIYSISENLSKHFRQKKAELLLKQGEKFKENYIEQVNKAYLQQSDIELSALDDQGFALAYRKAKEDGEIDSTISIEQLKKFEAVKRAKDATK